MKRFLVGMFSALLIVLCVLPWKTIFSVIFPRIMLSRSLEARAEQVYTWYDSSPIRVGLSFLHSNPDVRADYKLQYQSRVSQASSFLAGAVHFSPGKIQTEAVIGIDDKTMDLSVYLDRESLAIRSHDLWGGEWYGLPYRKVCEELSNNPAWHTMLGTAGHGFVNAAMETIGNILSWKVPQLPDIPTDMPQNIAAATFFLDLTVRTESAQILSGRDGAVVMTCEIPFAEFAGGLRHVSADLSDVFSRLFAEKPDTIQLEFLLFSGELRRVTAKLSDQKTACIGSIQFAEEEEQAGFSANIRISDLETHTGMGIRMQSGIPDTIYDHKITVVNENSQSIECSYHWNPLDRILWALFQSEGKCAGVFASLECDRLQILAEDVGALTEILLGCEMEIGQGSVTVRQGSPVPVPNYTDISNISKFHPGE